MLNYFQYLFICRVEQPFARSLSGFRTSRDDELFKKKEFETSATTLIRQF
jgi:hypothetical protein